MNYHSSYLLIFVVDIYRQEVGDYRVEELIKKFVLTGPTIKEKLSIEALAISLAKLSQEAYYEIILEKYNLIEPLILLLLDLVEENSESLIIRECCGIAISRISVKLSNVSNEIRSRIVKVILDMLDINDINVLINAIGSARVLG